MHSKLETHAMPIRKVRPAPSVRRAFASSKLPAASGVQFVLDAVQIVYQPDSSQRTIALTPSDRLVYVVVPARGTVVAMTAEGSRSAGEGEALLLARAELVSCVWEIGSAGMVMHVPRAAIQAQAARLFGAPRRLAGTVAVFDWTARPTFLSGRPFDACLAGNRLAETEAGERQHILCASLVRAMAAAGLEETAFPVAKSVVRALDHVRAHPHVAWAVEDLASVAGVTAATLRKNFRSCLGLTVTQVVRETRLQWVRRQLASPNESRSIARLAEAVGFGGAGALARAYQHRFGETPTQSRTRAFASVRE